MHGVGEHALGHVAEALRVAQGLSHNRLPMEARHALEEQQLLGPAAQFPAQVYLVQSCKKIIDLDLKDRDHLIDLDLLCDLDHYW